MTGSQTRPDAAAWRALPVAAVAALYVHGVQKFVRENLFVFAGAGTGFAVSERLGWYELGLALAALLLIGLLVAVVYHRRFRYRGDAAAMRVRQGLFEQKELKVGFERVQNVAFSQPFWMRPLRLVRVSLETPGAAQTEVRLPGIPVDEAVAIRDRVAAVQAAAPAAQPEAAEATVGTMAGQTQPAFRPGAANLFRYGLTSNQVWLVAALLAGPVSNWVERRVSDWIDAAASAGVLDPARLAEAPLLVALGVAALIVLLAVVLMALSGVIALIRFHDFELVVEQQRFAARYGLFDRRERTLKIARMHALELVQTTIGRLLGQWHAIGRQTGAVMASEALGSEDRSLLIPGIDRRQLETLAGRMQQREWSMPQWQPISRTFRNVLVWRSLVVLVAAAAMAGMIWLPWPVAAAPGGAALVAWLPLAGLYHLRWKRWGFARRDGCLAIRSGFIGQRIVEFDLDRCQQIMLRTSPVQRRNGLVSLAIRLPHGEVELPYIDERIGQALADQMLWVVESRRAPAL